MNDHSELLFVAETLPVLKAQTGLSIYDFDFRSYFPCRALQECPESLRAIARIGAFGDYEREYIEMQNAGITLLHSPDQHRRCSELPEWYPLIQDLTPRSRWYAEIPTVEQIESEFTWPVFIKGSRQTSRHQRALAIIRSPEEYRAAIMHYRDDRILSWQAIVVRELVPLKLVEDVDPTRIPTSLEFRTFWWHGQSVGSGRYWWEGRRYDWSEAQRRAALAVAQQVANRLRVAFLVVDVALTESGQWIVIECNDGQESGYAGVVPLALWSRIIDEQRLREQSRGS